MSPMTSTSEPASLRRVVRAATAYEKARAALDEAIADARTDGVPLVTIAKHTPFSREWARRIADRIDAERAAATAAERPPAEEPTDA